MYDIVIRGGTIVDGTGSEPYEADLAIKDGAIAAIGTIEDSGRQEIDATGKLVTPGFVDIHTHHDAQIGWDPDMTPVSWHGVPTALIGNCGVTFAPCKSKDREFLAGMMETVEDIPKHAILSGLSWEWEQYGEFLDTIAGLGTAINIAGLVGHSAIRYYVMGERSFEDQATDEEKQQMAELVAGSLEAGAFGFSTNRYEPHKAPDGRSIPGTFADVSELTVIAEAVGARRGMMQSVGADGETLAAIADTPGARILFSTGTAPDECAGEATAARIDKLAEGRDVTGISHVWGSGFIFGLQSGLPFKGDSWAALGDKDFEGRVNARDDDFVQADKAGENWIETFLRLTKETRGKALFNFQMFATNLKEQAGLFKSKNIYPGLGDAGAHVSQIMDAGWSSFILFYWARESGEFTVAEAVQKMTSGPARVLGLSDRGVLKKGLKADLNVIDFNEVSELQPELVHDFPGGAPRYIQRSKGFKATIVNGKVSLLDGEITGRRAGQVLRHASMQRLETRR